MKILKKLSIFAYLALVSLNAENNAINSETSLATNSQKTDRSGDTKKNEFDTIVVTAKGIDPIDSYTNTITKEQIEKSSTGNGDIGSMLRYLPNVQFNNTANSSLTPGEISPQKISISGGHSYQNLFLINGVKMNNDIDPETTSAWLGRPGGRSQGLDIGCKLIRKY